ncbi:LYR motif-containing protein 4 [Ochlerotatus camptorhynchus]|uniref:LYR motif-containing protein 4 n=1 Tax=Ochlerotatus camptorhynchus TaxID=644619 RepID=UPI0031D4ADC0
MSSAAHKMKVLSLYRQLLRESQKFSSYNFRNYALRRIRDAFRGNKALTDSVKIQSEMEFARKNLDTIKRQALISQMFRTDKLVIEK